MLTQLKATARGYRRIVEDRGRGPKDIVIGDGLGHRLIAALAAKLDARCAWEDARPGTRSEREVLAP